MTSDAIGQAEIDDLAEYNANEAADYKDEDKPASTEEDEDEDLSELLEDESDESDDDEDDEEDEDEEEPILQIVIQGEVTNPSFSTTQTGDEMTFSIYRTDGLNVRIQPPHSTYVRFMITLNGGLSLHLEPKEFEELRFEMNKFQTAALTEDLVDREDAQAETNDFNPLRNK